MELNRADSKLISADERRQVLADFDIPPGELLAVGTEAEVYALGETTILKLYAGASRLAYLETLKKLYENLDPHSSGLKLPQIQHIAPYEDLIAVIETRLEGEPLENLLPSLHGGALERAETLYLDSAWKLKDIQILEKPETYLLFDEGHLSDTSQGSFESFYAGFLAHKLERVGRFFESLDPSFGDRSAALVAAICKAPPAPLALVHGDFFPGNVLVDNNLTQVNGVIDFGSFTLFGDYLLDIAGAFGFYKMYDPDRKRIREQMLGRILRRLTEEERAGFFRFLLAHAILTCDLYAQGPDPRQDDHFRWAAEIVSEGRYWREAIL